MRKNNLPRTAGAIGAVALGIFCFATWLNLLPAAKELPAPALPSPNAYDALVAAAKLEPQTALFANKGQFRPFERESDSTLTDKATRVAGNTLTLYAVRKALTLPYWNPPVRSATTRLPELSAFRGLARLLVLDAQVKAAAGDAPGALNASLDAIELGVRIPRGGILVAALVGVGCETAGEHQAWSLIDRLDASGASAAAARLESITSDRFPFSKTMTEEERSGQAILAGEFQQRSVPQAYRDLVKALRSDGYQDHLDSLPFLDRVDNYRALLARSKRQIYDDYTTTSDLRIAQADKPWSANEEEISAPDDPVNALLMPSYMGTKFRMLAVQTNEGLLLTALALRVYHLRHGDYPVALASLVSGGTLHRVPDDPFARSFNIPFRYTRVSANKYLVYSVGPDGTDNGGQPISAQRDDRPHNFPAQGDIGDWVVGGNVGQPAGVRSN